MDYSLAGGHYSILFHGEIGLQGSLGNIQMRGKWIIWRKADTGKLPWERLCTEF